MAEKNRTQESEKSKEKNTPDMNERKRVFLEMSEKLSLLKSMVDKAEKENAKSVGKKERLAVRQMWSLLKKAERHSRAPDFKDIVGEFNKLAAVLESNESVKENKELVEEEREGVLMKKMVERAAVDPEEKIAPNAGESKEKTKPEASPETKGEPAKINLKTRFSSLIKIIQEKQPDLLIKQGANLSEIRKLFATRDKVAKELNEASDLKKKESLREKSRSLKERLSTNFNNIVEELKKEIPDVEEMIAKMKDANANEKERRRKIYEARDEEFKRRREWAPVKVVFPDKLMEREDGVEHTVFKPEKGLEQQVKEMPRTITPEDEAARHEILRPAKEALKKAKEKFESVKTAGVDVGEFKKGIKEMEEENVRLIFESTGDKLKKGAEAIKTRAELLAGEIKKKAQEAEALKQTAADYNKIKDVYLTVQNPDAALGSLKDEMSDLWHIISTSDDENERKAKQAEFENKKNEFLKMAEELKTKTKPEAKNEPLKLTPADFYWLMKYLKEKFSLFYKKSEKFTHQIGDLVEMKNKNPEDEERLNKEFSEFVSKLKAKRPDIEDEVLKMKKGGAKSPSSGEEATAESVPKYKREILDIPDNELLEIIGQRKLREVINEMILGNEQVAETLFKDIFSRGDIDAKRLNGVLKGFDKNPSEFMTAWAEGLYQRPFKHIRDWLGQSSRNWLNENINWWEKFKSAPTAYIKLGAMNFVPTALVVAGVGVSVTAFGVDKAVRSAVIGGSAGLLHGLKKYSDSVKNWFGSKRTKAREEITKGRANAEKEKTISLRQNLLEKFQGEEIFRQLSAMISQGLREASAAAVKAEAVEKVKAGAEAAIEQAKGQIEKEFESVKKREGEGTAEEIKESQKERVEKLITALYDTQEIEKLVQEVIEKDPQIVKFFEKLNLYNIDFGKLIPEDKKDPDSKRNKARKIAALLSSVAAGGAIGGMIAANPELRAILGAVAGGLLGAKWGHLKDKKEREKMFKEEFVGRVGRAENIVRQYEKASSDGTLANWATQENMEDLRLHTRDVRVPISLGMMDSDILLKTRGLNALRRMESILINLYMEKNPDAETKNVPDYLKNSPMEKLLSALNKDLEEFSKERDLTKEKLMKKPGWRKTAWYSFVGALTGAGAGLGITKIQEHFHGQHKLMDEEQIQKMRGLAGAKGVAAVAPAVGSVEPAHLGPTELPRATELPLHNAELPHTVEITTLTERQGMLSGVNKLMRDNPDLFKGWTKQQIHEWKVAELKDVGFKYEGGRWGHPFTVHQGAQVELFTDADGQPHFKLASEEHVTFNKYYKWEGAGRGTAGHQVDRPFSADEAYGPADKTVSGHEISPQDQIFGSADKTSAEYAGHEAVSGREAATPAAEHAVARESVAVEANIKEKAIAHHAEESHLASPTKPSVGVSAQEQTSPPVGRAGTKIGGMETGKVGGTVSPPAGFESQKQYTEFVATQDEMMDKLPKLFSQNFRVIVTPDAKEFTNSAIKTLYEKFDEAIKSGDKNLIANLAEAEKMYKAGDPMWMQKAGNILFEKDNEDFRLAFLVKRDYDNEPMLAGAGHVLRIYDPDARQDILIYDKDFTYSIERDGKLEIKDIGGEKIETLTHKEAIETFFEK